MPRRITFALIFAIAACGSGGNKTCDVAAQTGCGSGKVCEDVAGGSPACFDPVMITGSVFDLATPSTMIAGARVVALDANRAAVSDVAISATDGKYTLQVPALRASDGRPVASQVTLRADARQYQSFPGGLRVALPIDVSKAMHASATWTVANSLTDVGLIGLPDGAGTASIHGKVTVPRDHGGVLVVAESSASGLGTSAIADRSGAYAILNLPAGAYDVAAYARGVNYAPASVTLAATDDKEVDLASTNAPTATVTGTVNAVGNGASGLPTSVILVVESTFNAALGRGDAPPRLRDPASGLGVTGNFSIDGVPDGKYVALAAFEDDGLVRDQSTTGGTNPLEVVVANGVMTSAAGSFKITGALTLVSPGANGPELGIANPPVFEWAAYPATNRYRVTVYDTFGAVLWQYDYLSPPSEGPISLTYGAPTALVPGMFYQVQVESFGTTSSQYTRSEDLKGVFTVQ